MDEVGEFDGVLDEEHRDVVANQVPVAFLSIEFDGKSAHVAWGIDRTRAARDSRYTRKHGCLVADFGEDPGGGVLLQRGGQFEEAMRAGRSRVDDTLGNALDRKSTRLNS